MDFTKMDILCYSYMEYIYVHVIFYWYMIYDIYDSTNKIYIYIYMIYGHYLISGLE